MNRGSPHAMAWRLPLALFAALLAAEAGAAGYSGLLKEAPYHYDARTAVPENPLGDVVPAYVIAPHCADVVPGKTKGRTECQVRSIFERNTAELQSIYGIALKEHPEMKGALVLHLVISADGTVTRGEVVSSDLKEPETEKKLVERVKAMNFGTIEGQESWDDNYTLFFPSK